jgi:hypothetical protein
MPGRASESGILRARAWAVGLLIAAAGLAVASIVTPWAGVAQLVVIVLAVIRMPRSPHPYRRLLWWAIAIAAVASVLLAVASSAFMLASSP